jgi:hypothetical protein
MVTQVTSSQSSSSGSDTVAIVNIEAATNNKDNPVVQFLRAGTYEIAVIGTSEGGKYEAWSLWNFTTGCDERGENCMTGWVNEYNIASNEFNINMPSTGKYATAEQACAKAQNTSFTLTSDTQVKFFVSDDILPDNRGGMSLAVKKLRETSPYPQLNWGSLILIIIISLSVMVLWLLVNLVAGK